jgi:hypothetical protein|tara:strand:- start:259 stop:387 length:129 start_codon:yes stop_codon:yes gene_type:complete
MIKFEYNQIAYLDVLDLWKSVEPKKFGENSEFVVYYFKRELK